MPPLLYSCSSQHCCGIGKASGCFVPFQKFFPFPRYIVLSCSGDLARWNRAGLKPQASESGRVFRSDGYAVQEHLFQVLMCIWSLTFLLGCSS